MPVVFDTTFLALLYGPLPQPPLDPRTNVPVTRAADRVEHLVAHLTNTQTRILIPTPVLCELLCKGAGQDQIDIFGTSSRFQIVPFDVRAAVEAASAIRAALSRGDKRSGRSKATPWSKVKFDRQIVAIAKTRNATHIYSDDEDIAAYAADSDIDVITVADLDVPPPSQVNLPLNQAADASDPATKPE
jgi:predicted nucleic acid-binding protein